MLNLTSTLLALAITLPLGVFCAVKRGSKRDFAVQVGWLSADVIFYMAIVSIASFTQSNYELGYALKFIRLFTLVLTHFFNYWGFAIGIFTGFVLICTNKSVNGERSYLYPLIPFNGRAMARLLFRLKKP